jgi:hypothetical protein
MLAISPEVSAKLSVVHVPLGENVRVAMSVPLPCLICTSRLAAGDGLALALGDRLADGD